MFYDEDYKSVMSKLKTGISGLTESEVEKRLKEYGYNKIRKEEGINPFLLFLKQFSSPLVMLLVFAVVVAFFADEIVDGIVILIILLLNSILGFTQEFKAEKSIQALKKLSTPKALVLREGKVKEVNSEFLVPGDIIVLETGMTVSADARLIEVVNLETQEAILTGESTPVRKTTKKLDYASLISEQKNMVFSGTNVINGRGKAVVVRTGENTELGRIAKRVREIGNKETPLQLKLREVGNFLTISVIIITIIVFITSLARAGLLSRLFELTVTQEREFTELLIAAIALAVAAIPEGLPAVVTTTLALSVRKFVKKNVLIRKLSSVETLGCTSVICSDKTGTITCNEMTVKKIFVDNTIISVSGEGYSLKGSFSKRTKDLGLLLKIGVLCNNTFFDYSKSEVVSGSPTEAALLVSGAKYGLTRGELESKFKRIYEIPFSSKRKFMATVHKLNSRENIVFVKGAPDVIIEKCNRIIVNGKVKKLDQKTKNKILELNRKFSSSALRVLGFAFKKIHNKKSSLEKLVFVGLQAMIDPPRSDVKESIEKCKAASIRVVMITGDHKETALAIAKKVGISGMVINGSELDGVDLKQNVEKFSIYARVSPEHKFRILKALKDKNYIVAMTGDGVNDAPALKEADIGIAVGSGSDVAKEASDMILLDNSFSSIVKAVEEGRIIYSNIKKFIRFLLSSNFAEVLIIFLALLFGMPLPIAAVQILWINLLTDGLPALALGFEPKEPGIMRRKPRDKNEKILNAPELVFIIGIAITMTVIILLFFKETFQNLEYARTLVFTSLVVFEMMNVFNCKSEFRSVFRTNPFNNPLLLFSILFSILLQLIVLYTPLSSFFKTVPLSLEDWTRIILAGFIIIFSGEILKMINNELFLKHK